MWSVLRLLVLINAHLDPRRNCERSLTVTVKEREVDERVSNQPRRCGLLLRPQALLDRDSGVSLRQSQRHLN